MLKNNKIKVLLFTLSMTLFAANSVKAADYKVVSGDSLYTISKKFNTSVSTVMNNSYLTSSVIYPGQILNVPAKIYTVQSGDTLYLIAKKYVISLLTLRNANNYWSDYIYPGQTLLIPSTSYSQSSASTVKYGVIPYTESDVDLLARLIYAEAQGQPYKAEEAVGAVVVNRVQSSAWPNTISDVIYQRINGYYQFTPAANGWINKPASAEARQAALDSLNGYDPTNGAQFYFDDSTTNTWLWSKPIALRVGNMVFAY
jgi:spore germination cell wall hydrolase CwlJ-like protein